MRNISNNQSCELFHLGNTVYRSEEILWGFVKKDEFLLNPLIIKTIKIYGNGLENLRFLLGDSLIISKPSRVNLVVICNNDNRQGTNNLGFYENNFDVLEMLLNDSSVDLIMNGNLKKYPKSVEKVEELIENIRALGEDPYDYFLDSTVPLGLYGIRPIGDLDFLTLNEIPKGLEVKGQVENNIKYLQYHTVGLNTLLNNSDYYLVYKGIKVVTLNELSRWKTNKGTKKDIEDVYLIEAYKDKSICKRWKTNFILGKRVIKGKLYSIYNRTFRRKLKKIHGEGDRA